MDDGPGAPRSGAALVNVPVMSAVAGPEPGPVLSIVVVSWNCREMLARCLAEVFGSRFEVPYEVIVVDNASGDGTAEEIPRRFPEIRLLANTENLGFAKANNQGFALARGRFLMLLNPDAFPATPETFGRVLRFLEEHPEFAGAGCRLVHADGSHQVGDAGFKPSPGHVLAHAFGLSQLLPGRLGLFLGKVPTGTPWIDVDWICGAFLVVRREVVDAVGGLDEGYFLYGEDTEWGCRMRQNGHRLAYLPGETVLHLQGGTQDAAERLSTRWLDSTGILYARLNQGRHWWVFKLALSVGFALRALAYRALSLLPGRAGSRGKSRAMWVYARHVWRMPWRAPGFGEKGTG